MPNFSTQPAPTGRNNLRIIPVASSVEQPDQVKLTNLEAQIPIGGIVDIRVSNTLSFRLIANSESSLRTLITSNLAKFRDRGSRSQAVPGVSIVNLLSTYYFGSTEQGVIISNLVEELEKGVLKREVTITYIPNQSQES